MGNKETTATSRKPSTVGPRAWGLRGVLANSASRALMVLPEVVWAEFSISGSPADPVLGLRCRLRSQQDLDTVTRQISEHVIPDLEKLVDCAFTRRDLGFALQGGPAAATPEPGLNRLPALVQVAGPAPRPSTSNAPLVAAPATDAAVA